MAISTVIGSADDGEDDARRSGPEWMGTVEAMTGGVGFGRSNLIPNVVDLAAHRRERVLLVTNSLNGAVQAMNAIRQGTMDTDRRPDAPPTDLLDYLYRIAPTKEALRHVLVSLSMSIGAVLLLVLCPLVLAAVAFGGTTLLGWFGAVLGGTATIAGSVAAVRRRLARRNAADEQPPAAEFEAAA